MSKFFICWVNVGISRQSILQIVDNKPIYEKQDNRGQRRVEVPRMYQKGRGADKHTILKHIQELMLKYKTRGEEHNVIKKTLKRQDISIECKISCVVLFNKLQQIGNLWHVKHFSWLTARIEENK